jgi:hypothetical protein
MRWLTAGVLAAALLACAFGSRAAAGAASPASAAPGRWSLQHTPGASTRSLLSVSCASATACTATGARTSGTINRTIAEGWNGTRWSAEPTPKISGGTDSFLRGVSCTSAASCVAVGDYWNGTMDVTLAERWNGSAWSAVPVPDPSGAVSSYLFGVSCVSARACTAVGDYISSNREQEALAERWDGSAWSIQPTRGPPGPRQNVLLGVSCTAASACIAVGLSTKPSGASRTLAERWNGSAWSIQPTPNPAGAQLNSLAGVSCTGPAACTAVGNDSPKSTSTLTLAEAWNGSAWSIRPTPNPTSATNSYLSGVSCTSATACTASGYFLTRGRTDVNMAMGWNGSAWSIQRTIRPASAVSSFLNGVSCTSAVDCTAVGNYVNALSTPVALAERHSAG